jgi:hypothetical protein
MNIFWGIPVGKPTRYLNLSIWFSQSSTFGRFSVFYRDSFLAQVLQVKRLSRQHSWQCRYRSLLSSPSTTTRFSDTKVTRRNCFVGRIRPIWAIRGSPHPPNSSTYQSIIAKKVGEMSFFTWRGLGEKWVAILEERLKRWGICGQNNNKKKKKKTVGATESLGSKWRQKSLEENDKGIPENVWENTIQRNESVSILRGYLVPIFQWEIDKRPRTQPFKKRWVGQFFFLCLSFSEVHELLRFEDEPITRQRILPENEKHDFATILLK